MNKRRIVFIAIGAAAAVIVTFAFIIPVYNGYIAARELTKLVKGEITEFQYCSYRGKAAVDDPFCKDFNLRYGPPNITGAVKSIFRLFNHLKTVRS
ncbi:MAG TPA: hypothetical protein VF884_05385 [Nitrososphaeraceae archaeon]